MTSNLLAMSSVVQLIRDAKLDGSFVPGAGGLLAARELPRLDGREGQQHSRTSSLPTDPVIALLDGAGCSTTPTVRGGTPWVLRLGDLTVGR